jgi:hypothetical protein
MRSIRAVVWPVAALSFLISYGSSHAAQRTFVASTGSDAAACSLPAPCRSFAAAIAQTDPSGEVIVLDSAGYGGVTITKAVSIIAPPGVYAGVSVFTGTGIAINGASITVALRGLALNGLGAAVGIDIVNAGAVIVDRCTVSNFTDTAIRANGSPVHLQVSDTVLFNNFNGLSAGGDDNVVLSRLTVDTNGNGVIVATGSQAVVTDSVLRANGVGIHVYQDGASITRLAIDRSAFSENSVGVQANMLTGSTASSRVNVGITRSVFQGNGDGVFGSTSGTSGLVRIAVSDSLFESNLTVGVGGSGADTFVTLSRNTITHNGTGIDQLTSATIETTGDNVVRHNTTGVSGTLTPIPTT